MWRETILQGIGTETFTFYIIAPATPTTWRLNIHAFYWNGDWIQDDMQSVYVTVRSSSPRGSPPTLDLFDPEVRGLTVTINGVTLPGTPGATITRIQWDWGDGFREDRWFAASHTYSRPGTYTITVTSFQSDGLSTTRSVTVTLSEPRPSQPPSLDLFTPEIQGLTVRINGVALPGTPGTVISQIHWDWRVPVVCCIPYLREPWHLYSHCNRFPERWALHNKDSDSASSWGPTAELNPFQSRNTRSYSHNKWGDLTRNAGDDHRSNPVGLG
jgi:hypothetical protein